MLDKPLIESIAVTLFPDGRLDAKNAARYLGLKEKTLAMMRGQGTGPRFIKRGRIFYYKEDLDAWLKVIGVRPDKLTVSKNKVSICWA